MKVKMLKRKSNLRNISAIFLADYHIRSSQPVSRTDNFFKALQKKTNFIIEKSNQYNVPVIMAGDIGNEPEWENWLLTWTITTFLKFNIQPIVIAGQHDLPNHNFSKLSKSAIKVLETAGVIQIIGNLEMFELDDFILYGYGYSTNDKIIDIKKNKQKRNVALIHKLITNKDVGWESNEGISARSLIEKYLGYDIFVCGDNHQAFTLKNDNRLVLNCGSIMRATANQISHLPSIWLWDAQENEIERVYLPIEDKVFNTDHLFTSEKPKNTINNEEKEFNSNLPKFLKVLESKQNESLEGQEIRFKFQKNMEVYLGTNRVHSKVSEKIWGAIGGK